MKYKLVKKDVPLRYADNLKVGDYVTLAIDLPGDDDPIFTVEVTRLGSKLDSYEGICRSEVPTEGLSHESLINFNAEHVIRVLTSSDF